MSTERFRICTASSECEAKQHLPDCPNNPSGGRSSEGGLRAVVADVERELRFRAGLAGTTSWAELTAESMLEIADDLRDALSASPVVSPEQQEGPK